MSWQPPGWQPPGWQPPGWQPGAPVGGGVSAVLTGTIEASSVFEASIVAGGQTIIITLTGDTWVAGGTFTAQRQAIIDGITSAQLETFGWNNEVRDKEVPGAVTRDTDTQVTILLTASSLYDITTSESIVVTVPAAALVTSVVAIVATPALQIFETVKGMQPVSGRKPLRKRISARSIVFALSGPEQPYPVYPFSRRQFVEKPGHNPFKGL